MSRLVVNKWRLLNYLLFSVVVSIFFIPNIMLAEIPVGKFFFVCNLLIIYGLIIFSTKKITTWEALYFLFILINCVFTGTTRSITLITLLPLARSLNYWTEEEIKVCLKKSKLLYFAAFTIIIYSVFLFSHDGRLIHTAMKDVNESSLAIFCLGMIMLKKRKMLGCIILISGLLTFSRNYWLAFTVFLCFKDGMLKKTICFLKLEKWSLTRILAITSVCLLGVGLFFLFLYKENLILYSSGGVQRILSLFDTSNYDRFTVNYLLCIVLVKNLQLIFTGIPNYGHYLSFMADLAKKMKVPFRKNIPHNYVFSSIRLYGLPLTIITVLFLSQVFKRVVNKKNFSIFWGVILYAVFLGSGFEMYWGYLTFFALIANKGD